MQTQTLTFAVQTITQNCSTEPIIDMYVNKETARIGRGVLYQPRPSFAGGSISWFDDRTLLRQKN